MEQISKTRAKEILKTSETDKDLFNWCEEYKSFISENVSCCVSMEWDYMLKASYEDSGSPVNYEDLQIEVSTEDIKLRMAESFGVPIKELNSLYEDLEREESISFMGEDYTKEDLEEKYDEVKDELISETEIYEWWIIRDPLKYELEQTRRDFLKRGLGSSDFGAEYKFGLLLYRSISK